MYQKTCTSPAQVIREQLVKRATKTMANYWFIKQNPYQVTNETQMRNFILTQQVVTCPFGHFSEFTQNVISKKYNDENTIWSSKNQDKKFIDEIEIDDIILISFRKEKCILAKITSDPIENFDTGLFVSRHGQSHPYSKIEIINNTTNEPFRPVVRRIEIIKELTFKSSIRRSLCKTDSFKSHI